MAIERCRPCRVTYQSTRYAIDGAGNVTIATVGNEAIQFVADSTLAKAVRHEAARQRRNRNARERHQAMLDLGLARVRRGLGGVYYE